MRCPLEDDRRTARRRLRGLIFMCSPKPVDMRPRARRRTCPWHGLSFARASYRLGELCRVATDTSHCRRVLYVSLFVVCRYLSRIESSTIFDTTASRAFRAVSRETPYFAASSFSRIFRNSLPCERSRLIACLTCSSFVGLRRCPTSTLRRLPLLPRTRVQRHAGLDQTNRQNNTP